MAGEAPVPDDDNPFADIIQQHQQAAPPPQQAAPAPQPSSQPAPAVQSATPTDDEPFADIIQQHKQTAPPPGQGTPALAPTPVSTAPPAQKPTPEKPSPQTEPEYKPVAPVSDDSTYEEKMKAFAQNLLPSVWAQTKGVAHAVIHPIDTAKGIWSFGTGIKALIDESTGGKLTPEQEEAAKPVRAFWEQKKDTYGTDLNHFFTAFSNNPGEIFMDASLLLTGGEALAAKVPGLATAAKVAGTVGRAVDPLRPAVTVARGALGAVGIGTKAATAAPGRFLTRGGTLTREADDAIARVSDGTMSAADIRDHGAAAATLAREGGINDASVRTLIMQQAHPDVAPSLPIVQGVLKDEKLRPDMMRVAQNNERMFSQGVEDIAGGRAPEHTNLGRALDEAATENSNHVAAQYDQVAAMGHQFHPNALRNHFPVNRLLPAVEQNLVRGNFITAGSANPIAALSRQAYPLTADAVTTIAREMRRGATAVGMVPMRVTERVRAQLNDLFHTAKGSDRAGLRAVIDGFDDTVQHAAQQPGMLLTRAGAVAPATDVQGLVDTMTRARAAAKDYHDTFTATGRRATPQSSQIATHTSQLFAAQSPTGTKLRAPSANDSAYVATGSTLNSQLLHPTKGPSLYDHLVGTNTTRGALRSPDAAASDLRVAALRDNVRQSLAALPAKDLALHMKPTGLAAKVFNADELSRLRAITASRGFQEALVKKPHKGLPKPSLFGSLHDPMQRRIIGGLAGHFISPGIGGAISGAMAEGVLENILKKSAYRKMSRVMREPGTMSPGVIGHTMRLAKGVLNAPVNYPRAFAQANVAGNVTGAYAQKDRGAKATAQAGGDVAPILATIRRRESAGEANPYTAVNRSGKSSASGAYQFIDDTWQRLTRKYGVGTQYARAAHAPPAVQDKVAELYTRELLQQAHGDVSKIPLAWFTGNMSGQFGPGGAEANPGMSPSRYQQLWLAEYAKHARGTRVAASGGRIERATGGSVRKRSHEQLVRRLMGMADTARREVNKSTKPLLDMHDNAVAHALAVANRAI